MATGQGRAAQQTPQPLQGSPGRGLAGASRCSAICASRCFNQPFAKMSRAAAMVASMSASLCAIETKPASNAEGAR